MKCVIMYTEQFRYSTCYGKYNFINNLLTFQNPKSFPSHFQGPSHFSVITQLSLRDTQQQKHQNFYLVNFFLNQTLHLIYILYILYYIILYITLHRNYIFCIIGFFYRQYKNVPQAFLQTVCIRTSRVQRLQGRAQND